MKLKPYVILFLTTFLTVLSISIATNSPVNAAATTTYNFSDVSFPDGKTGDIVAKTTNRPAATGCAYWSNRGTFLGRYHQDGVSFKTANEVKRFCLKNYEKRVK